MKCMILAAGYATRLYPLTENFPKPLLKVQDKTILDWLIDDIDAAGAVDEYVVISNHKFAHHFEAWAKEKQQKITVVDDGTDSNETRLGAVKDILFAVEKLGLDDDMLVIAGDNLLEFHKVPQQISGYEYEFQEAVHCIREGKTEAESMPMETTVQVMEIMDSLRRTWGVVYPQEQ